MEKKYKDLLLIEGDIRDLKKLESNIKQSDVVVHLAAIARVDNCIELENVIRDINTNASVAIAKLCEKYNKKLIFASSCSVYGLIDEEGSVDENYSVSPNTIYAKTKYEAEDGILKTNSDSTILRFATAFGQSYRMRYDLFINEILRDSLIRKKIVLFDPDYWRCYIHLTDMAKAVIFFIEKEAKHKIYNVGSNEMNLNKREIVELLKKKISNFEIDILRNKKDQRNYKVNFDRLKEEGFSVKKGFDEGLDEMISYLRNADIDPYDKKFSNYN